MKVSRRHLAYSIFVITVIISCTNGAKESSAKQQPGELPQVGSRFEMENQLYTVEADLTSGAQAHVFQAVRDNDGKRIVVKIPKAAKNSPFSDPTFFESYYRFTSNLTDRNIFYIVEQKPKTISIGEKSIRAYAADFVEGKPLESVLTSDRLGSIEKEVIAEKLAHLYRNMHSLSMKKKAFLSDVSKLDNIMIDNDLSTLRIIDGIVIDRTINRKELKEFSEQVLAKPEALERIYMNWGFSALHTMITDHDLYPDEISSVIRSYLYTYILADNKPNEKLLLNISELLLNHITFDPINPFNFQIKEIKNADIDSKDPFMTKFKNAFNDFKSFRESYIKPDGSVNHMLLEWRFPPKALCGQ